MNAYPLTERLVKGKLSLRSSLSEIEMDLMEKRLTYLVHVKGALSSLTTKFTREVSSFTDYSRIVTVVRTADLLSTISKNIRFLELAENQTADLSVQIARESVLFVITKVAAVGAQPSGTPMTLSEIGGRIEEGIRAGAGRAHATDHTMALVVEVDAFGNMLSMLKETLETAVGNDPNSFADLSAILILYPETLGLASPAGELTRDYGILIINPNGRRPLKDDVVKELNRALTFQVSFAAEGIESQGMAANARDGLVAGLYAFFSMLIFTGYFNSIPTLSYAAQTVDLLKWPISIVSFCVVLVRPNIAKALSNSDLVVRAFQNFPKAMVVLLVVLAMVFSLSPNSAPNSLPTIDLRNVGFFVAAIVLCVPIYFMTRLYSAAGFTRVYLLHFLKNGSNDSLMAASHSLNQSLHARGLRIDPYTFRGGVSLGLMSGKITETQLDELAQRIVGDSRVDQHIVITRVGEIIGQFEGSRILPLRPIRDNLTRENLKPTLEILAGIITIVGLILRFVLHIL